MGFIRFPRMVSCDFWEMLRDTFPALAGDGRKAEARRRIAEYSLFGSYRYETAALLASRDTIAVLVGMHPKTRGFSAEYWLDAFDAEVFPLNVTEAAHWEGKARVIRPDIPAKILAARDKELTRDPGERPLDRVDFVTGKKVSRREHRRAVEEYEHALEPQRGEILDHPAKDMLDCLNGQSPKSLGLVLSGNWSKLMVAHGTMPQGTLREQRRRDSATRSLLKIQESAHVVYGGSERTTRLFARGAPVNLLPRELRLVALGGNPRLDLRACQLAVVGMLWNIESLQDLLGDPSWSIWTELLSYLGLGESHKPILKDTLYALLFGMGRLKLESQLAEGTELVEGVAGETARRFFKYPLIRDLLKARKTAIRRVTDLGGAVDAFGRSIILHKYEPHQILAQQAQSYEVRIMRAALPILQEEDVGVLAWLHDGLVVRIHNRSKEERRVRQIVEAVGDEAKRLDIRTTLQREE